MKLKELEWIEFHYADEDTEVTIAGHPSLVIEAADMLPDELTETAVVYSDDEDGEEGHVHIFNAGMRRNPDGSWQWPF